MTCKNLVLCVVIFLVIVGNAAYLYKRQMVEFIPMELDASGLELRVVEYPELKHDLIYLDSFEHILKKYRERYQRVDAQTIYIHRSLAADTELLHNYCIKADLHRRISEIKSFNKE